MIFWKILLVVVIVFAVLFLLTFVIYFFNLDMKAAALIMPVFRKHYDRVDRKKEREKAQKTEREKGQQEKEQPKERDSGAEA